jgi:hypothetical protein
MTKKKCEHLGAKSSGMKDSTASKDCCIPACSMSTTIAVAHICCCQSISVPRRPSLVPHRRTPPSKDSMTSCDDKGLQSRTKPRKLQQPSAATHLDLQPGDTRTMVSCHFGSPTVCRNLGDAASGPTADCSNLALERMGLVALRAI